MALIRHVRLGTCRDAAGMRSIEAIEDGYFRLVNVWPAQSSVYGSPSTLTHLGPAGLRSPCSPQMVAD